MRWDEWHYEDLSQPLLINNNMYGRSVGKVWVGVGVGNIGLWKYRNESGFFGFTEL